MAKIGKGTLFVIIFGYRELKKLRQNGYEMNAFDLSFHLAYFLCCFSISYLQKLMPKICNAIFSNIWTLRLRKWPYLWYLSYRYVVKVQRLLNKRSISVV